MVPGGGFEPPHLAAAVFETATSTDSVTPAQDDTQLTNIQAARGAHYHRNRSCQQ